MTLTCLYAQEQNEPSVHGTRLKTIIVDDYYPYTFVNKDENPDGFSVDLMKAVTRVMGIELTISVDTWENALQALLAGEIDFLPMMAYSIERDRLFDFSVPHTIGYDAFFSRKNSRKIRRIEDLKGKEVIVMKNDQAHDYLNSIDFIKPGNIIFVDTISEALRLLASGRGDTALMPKLVGLIQVDQMKLNNLEASTFVIEAYNRPFSFAVVEGNQVLLEKLSQGLSIVEATKQYNIIYETWFGGLVSPGISAGTILKYVIISILIFLITASTLALWSFTLRKKVVKRTADLEKEIQERKRAEQALMESENKLSAILNNVSAYIFIKDLNYRYTYVNKMMCSLFNLSYDEIVGKTSECLFDPELCEQITREDKRVLEQGEAVTSEKHLNISGGERRTYLVAKLPLKDENHTVYAI